MQKINLKKGDTVKVIAGNEKGKTGRIMKILSKRDRVIIEKVNFIKKHHA